MQTIERHLFRLCERLAQENRRLLALLVLGYTLSQAEQLLGVTAASAREHLPARRSIARRHARQGKRAAC